MRTRSYRLLLPFVALTLAARAPQSTHGKPIAASAMESESWTAHPASLIRMNCGTCEISFCGHTVVTGAGDDYGNPHMDCIAIPNCDGHPTCSVAYLPEFEKRRFTELVEGAVNGSIESVEILLRDFGEVAELNGERESLQIRGCDPGTYVANIPLTPLEFASASQYTAEVAARN